MKKVLIATLLLLISFSCKKEVSEKVEKKAILAVMKAQETAWSNHNLEGYMQGYWKSDSLKFYGSNGLTYGWNKTLSNYKKGYPTKAHSGVLKFKVNDISKITNGAYFVMGEYHLTRKVGNAKGVFMIIFKKIKNQWKIIADTSC
ncbi:nuclear transport factor 2 family protein [Tenacibaculum dicentrarchi]|uniref:nuclear transport factor 2 family protein n=1 Tax=Tenacibaculum dicentrarchi TaxID=669041 RepID=UPI001BE8437F|nr:nuclear transport factor 2 family protein [Tenacibaculum dicentrarchi]MCD8420122.1 nuclear transport factor 2 family protein [Tenacibaculum dicentrarchi]MCD8437464.1 nuclear transport factor 2 family protein [Tenacibaculum dicentrarchi]MCD8451578.1 nuclear transport factor 2 family protein [Tenacibaculum dicentrarchi]MCG8828026.1 nuclear transport factor 2 family protein [Tenacibaculum dicentrarchi]